ncbi:MAG: 4'-phosphopantetheinyl transferase superfamily protein [Thermodesulfobacteriota bacterium]|nr:4'-phosphopantetheinyl transferase superfamily protein [Thermodesulfobacteriota bacterium]
MILVSYTHFDSRLPEDRWRHYLHRVSGPVQRPILRYHRWQDRQAGLFGKLLLQEGLREYSYDNVSLDDLSYNPFGRPFLDHPLDFNISHSHGYVICSITERGRVGIDIEKIRAIDLSDFQRYMSPQEWKNVQEAASPYERFYEYWTMKESIIKADGSGLSIPLEHVRIKENRAELYHTRWFLREIGIHFDCKCHLATDLESPPLTLREFQFH